MSAAEKLVDAVSAVVDFARSASWATEHAGLRMALSAKTGRDGDWCNADGCPRCDLVAVYDKLDDALIGYQNLKSEGQP